METQECDGTGRHEVHEALEMGHRIGALVGNLGNLHFVSFVLDFPHECTFFLPCTAPKST